MTNPHGLYHWAGMQLQNDIKMRCNVDYGSRRKPPLMWRLRFAWRVIRWQAVL